MELNQHKEIKYIRFIWMHCMTDVITKHCEHFPLVQADAPEFVDTLQVEWG